MNKKSKTLILSIIICIVGGIIGLLGQQFFHYIKFKSMYNNLFIEDKRQVIFLGRPTCGYCNLLKPIMDETTNKYNIDYLYINTDWLKEKELDKILKALDIRKKTFTTPRILITEDNKVINQNIGYIDDIELFHFLKNNSLIDKDELFENPYPNIERINSKTLFSLYENDEQVYVIVGRIGDKNVNSILKGANDKNISNAKFLSPSMIEDEDMEKVMSLTNIKEETKLPVLIEINNNKTQNLVEDVKEEDLKF